MLSHERIWAAIDKLAAAHDLTPSGLAKRAGLDSTTFNKSKRFSADGRARWPSTESIAKIVDATGSNLSEFLAFVGSTPSPTSPGIFGNSNVGLHDADSQAAYSTGAPTSRRVPVLGLAQAGSGGFFDDAGFPAGEGWDEVALPGADGLDERAYALEITGESMLPLYRAGDRIIVSPAANVRKGDRVVVKTRDGEVMAKILKRVTGTKIELASANPDHEDRQFVPTEIEWMARIVWASQ